MSDSVKTVLSCLFTALSVGRIFGIPRRVILCMSLGLGMIGYAIALLANDSSGTINAFLDTLNGSIYDGAVVTLFVCGILLIIIGTSLYIACQKPEESSEIVKTNCPSIETFDKVLGLPLELYIGIMLVILCLVSLVASVYGGIFFSMVENQLGNRMISQVKNDYYNETSTDQFSVAWNRMQEKFGCCGAVDYRDYRNSTYHRTIGQLVPFTCCRNGNGIGVAECRREAMIPINPRCNGQSPTVGDWKLLNPCGCHAHVSPILNVFGIIFFAISMAGCILSVVLLTCNFFLAAQSVSVNSEENSVENPLPEEDYPEEDYPVYSAEDYPEEDYPAYSALHMYWSWASQERDSVRIRRTPHTSGAQIQTYV